MYMAYKLLLPLLLFATIFYTFPFGHNKTHQLVHIGVLYEALCPDSVHFLLGPLSDAYEKFKQYLQLELVPYGKAHVDENGKITCQHGPRECHINKFQSCVIRYLSKEPLPYIVCLERAIGYGDSGKWKQMARECFRNLSVSSRTIGQIEKCYDGPEGDTLQWAEDQRTYSVRPDPMTFIPWILINNQSDAELQPKARNDLTPFICKLLGDKVKECAEY